MTFFKYNDIELYYEVAGKGPPLLLIGGLGCDTRLLEPLTNQLKSSFTVIGYDMRCAGQSDKPTTLFTISELADEARALIKYLGYKKPCALGFSMGGVVVMDMALRHSDTLDKIFLVATAPSLKRPPYPIAPDITAMLHRTEVSPELLTQVYENIFGPEYKKRVSAEAFIKFRMEDVNPQPADAYLNQLRACEANDLCDSVCKIKAPTFVIVGDQDRLIPPKNSRWLKEQIPNSKLFIFKGVGHMVPLEAPEKLANVVVAGAF